MKVLYLHPAASFGGASKSLIELIRAFPKEAIQATVICPRGPVAESFGQAGMEVIECSGLMQLDNTQYGQYRGLRWLILLRELWLFFPTAMVLYRTLRHRSFDLIHLNEITLLPTVYLIRKFSDSPLITHVRSVQSKKQGLLANLMSQLLARTDGVVAIDQTVARSLPNGCPVCVIHNGISVPTKSSVKVHLPRKPLRVVMVGGLLRLKGVYEFVEAANICRNRGLSIEFLLAGDNPRNLTRFNRYLLSLLGLANDVRTDLERYIKEKNLGDIVKLLGFVSDVRSLYEKVHLLCFPSHLNAAGRPVFEAAFHSVPSLIAINNPESDTVIHQTTGICISANNPEAIADAIEYLIENPDELIRMGINAKRLAFQNFDIEKNALEMLDFYRTVLIGRPG